MIGFIQPDLDAANGRCFPGTFDLIRPGASCVGDPSVQSSMSQSNCRITHRFEVQSAQIVSIPAQPCLEHNAVDFVSCDHLNPLGPNKRLVLLTGGFIRFI